jgi:hypothetical protein
MVGYRGFSVDLLPGGVHPGEPAHLDERAAPAPGRSLPGPVSPLSFTGAPVFLSVYTDFRAFCKANGFPPSTTSY